ncbi:ankyrin repeat domain-containing protein [Candidatus Babeliales bacterium]|nr:ankyrin repeat domain-containing protein [Candidatus Babeliales bacterium]
MIKKLSALFIALALATTAQPAGEAPEENPTAPLIFAAIQTSNLPWLKKLITTGTRTTGLGLLSFAASHRRAEIVSYLLKEAHADVDEQDELGRTAAHLAARMGATQIVEELVNNGADMTIADQFGRVPQEYYDGSDEKLTRLLTPEY